MKQIDLSKEKFDFIGCSEGNIFFDTFSEGEKFRVKVWGIILMHELGIEEKDVYVNALSELVFEDVKYVSIDYGIYANKEGTEFVKNINEDSTDMRLTLGKKEHLSEYVNYIIGGILGRNLGYGEITIYCKGFIKLIYNEKSLVDVRDFCLNTKKYRIQ